MSVLLDECVPKRLLRHLSGYEFTHALDLGWGGKKNGELLKAMREANFSILVTVDKNLIHQQNVQSSGIAVITMAGKSNRVIDLMPLIPTLLQTISAIKPGDMIEVS
jgi:predicted nuclease of predicted toxin-antitoxin system